MKAQRKQASSAEIGGPRCGHPLGAHREGIQAVARRHGITHQAAWGILADSLDALRETSYRRGHRDGRLSAMPNLPRVA